MRTKPRSETSAGGVVVRLSPGQPLVLLIQDSHGNWGFPKGHVESQERPEAAALREVFEETGLTDLSVRQPIGAIEWYFRFRGQLIHKVCHFFLMETAQATTLPQAAEGITACRWMGFDEAHTLISYANARAVLRDAQQLVAASAPATS